MQTMIEIEGKIVVTDILTAKFCCDISLCKGICCVEGNSGAPLEPGEIPLLEREYAHYSKYMTAEGILAVERQGFSVLDEDGDETTPLVDNAECAYSYNENGVTLCAIEKAYREGKTHVNKPISCHLYPIRVTKFSDGSMGLNYHKWDVCEGARLYGANNGVLLYKSLREPIVRCFGEGFYEGLEAAAQFLKENE